MYNEEIIHSKRRCYKQQYEGLQILSSKNQIASLHNKQIGTQDCTFQLHDMVQSGNQYFRFYDIPYCRGSYLWWSVVNSVGSNETSNGYFNEITKQRIELILHPIQIRIYITFEKLIDKLNPKDPVKFLDQICTDKIEPFIDGKYAEL